jgi:glucose-6-phosphate isomerase
VSNRVDMPAWKNLRDHAAEVEIRHLRQLFADDPNRFEHLSITALDFLFDYPRQRVTPTYRVGAGAARDCDMEGRSPHSSRVTRSTTPSSAAMHMALRNHSGRPMNVDGRDVMPGSRRNAKIASSPGVHEAASRVRRAPGSDVVNIGIRLDLGIVAATGRSALPQPGDQAALFRT